MKVPVFVSALFFWFSSSVAVAQVATFGDIFGPPTVSLEIQPAVELVFPSARGYRYKLFHSTDLNFWEELPGEYDGTGSVLSIFRRARPNVRGFYQVEASLRILQLPEIFSGKGKLHLSFSAASAPKIVELLDNSRYAIGGAVEEQGALSGAFRTNNTWVFTAAPDTPGNAFLNGEVQLEFLRHNGGNYAVTRSDGNRTEGLFSFYDNTPPVGEGLSGKILEVGYSSGGKEQFAFVSDTAVSYENGAQVGTYTYYGNGARIIILLQNRWAYEITVDESRAMVLFSGPNSPPEQSADPADYKFYDAALNP